MYIMSFEENKFLLPTLVASNPEAIEVLHQTFANRIRDMLSGEEVTIRWRNDVYRIKCNKLAGYAFEFLFYMDPIVPDVAALFLCTNGSESESSSFWDEMIDEHDGIDDKERYKKLRPPVPWGGIAHLPVLLEPEHAEKKRGIWDICVTLANVVIMMEKGELPPPH